MISAEQDENRRQHQRRIARPHAEGGADLEAERLQAEEAPEGDEDRSAKAVDGIHEIGFIFRPSRVFSLQPRMEWNRLPRAVHQAAAGP